MAVARGWRRLRKAQGSVGIDGDVVTLSRDRRHFCVAFVVKIHLPWSRPGDGGHKVKNTALRRKGASREAE